jgi:excisionase family DNA binding protein
MRGRRWNPQTSSKNIFGFPTFLSLRRRLTEPPLVRCRFRQCDNRPLPIALTTAKIETISYRDQKKFYRGGVTMMNDHNRTHGNSHERLQPDGFGSSRGNRVRHEPPEQSSNNVSCNTIPFVQRLACTVPEACEATGIGRTKLYELIGNGRLVTTTIGRRRLVLVHSLLSLLAMAHE